MVRKVIGSYGMTAGLLTATIIFLKRCGNCWITLAIPELIDILNLNEKYRKNGEKAVRALLG